MASSVSAEIEDCMFFWLRSVITWSAWLLLADKKRWRELLPLCFFASYLGVLSDILMGFYPLWEYAGHEHQLVRIMGDDLSLYIVVPYLFIQWLPRQQSPGRMAAYWFAWTALCIAIEWIHIHTGHMVYLQWWNIGCSYLADWLLFWLFYRFYKLFRLHRLSGP